MDEKTAPEIVERCRKFAIRIIRVTSALPKNPAGFAIASQLVRAGTGIGANLEEAQESPTKKDFCHKVSICIKEARETLFWLVIMRDSKLLPSGKLNAIIDESEQVLKILKSILKSAKRTH